MESSEIRSKYLAFFRERGHAVLPSAFLVPENDPTVLFTTAGMHPLVPFLLGEPHPLGTRLASAQKCVRTGDIDEVGDNRHCTFFEMMGNWSLGDYFKKESIAWSWEFLTSSETGLGLDPLRIYVTVFAGDADAPRDDESIAVWTEAFKRSGVSAEVDKPVSEGGRIFTMQKDSNWWGPAGQTGPCGPDTEMYYDIGREGLAQTLPDGMPDFESGRLVEIWNNVFMQFNKTVDGTFEPLSQRNVDTGMGLERVAMVCQDVDTVFETDLFAGIMGALRNALSDDVDGRALRIVADHIRAAVFMVADGVQPSNKERGYILRRLVRRAILHSQNSRNAAWLLSAIAAVIDTYESYYSELSTRKTEIHKALEDEFKKFSHTIENGKKEIAKRETLTGKDAFDLYQSYGFPLELTKEYALSRGVTLDEAEFEREFENHQNLSRTASAGQFKSGLADNSEQTVRYHTATHLLHQALRDVLGDGVQQRGSNITPERLRFDFSYHEKMTLEQQAQVDEIVNSQIKAAIPVNVATMAPEQAAAEGAIGLFGHKYGDSVTVYTIGTYSKEICTGPHVANTKELGQFKIIKEEAVSAGVRRIKAVLTN